jgi:hypothetical protein
VVQHDRRARNEQDARRELAEKPEWREWIESDLLVARAMSWRYEWVGELPRDVYDVLIEMLNREADERQRLADEADGC